MYSPRSSPSDFGTSPPSYGVPLPAGHRRRPSSPSEFMSPSSNNSSPSQHSILTSSMSRRDSPSGQSMSAAFVTPTHSPQSQTSESVQPTPLKLGPTKNSGPVPTTFQLAFDVHVDVYVAHSGQKVDLSLRATETVQALKMRLTSQTDIPSDLLILLTNDGVTLSDRHPLSKYAQVDIVRSTANPEPTKVGRLCVYVFNRVHASSKTSEEDEHEDIQDVESFEVKMQALNVSATEHHLLQSSRSVMVRNLPHYVHHFEHHIEQAQKYIAASSARVRSCWSHLNVTKVRNDALSAAIKNLNGHGRNITAKFTVFHDLFLAQAEQHRRTLEGFEPAIGKLLQVRLHEALQTPSKTTLLDCVNEAKLRNWSSMCREQFDKLEEKVNNLRKLHEKVQAGVESASEPFSLSRADELQKTLRERADAIIEEENTILQALTQDHEKATSLVSRLVAEMQTAPDNSVTTPVDECTAFEVQDKQHQEDLLPRLRELDAELKNLQIEIINEKQRQWKQYFRKRLSLIADLQRKIKLIANKSTIFREFASKVAKDFVHVENIAHFPETYEASIEEVKRRNAFQKEFDQITSEAQAKLETLLAEEKTCRERFTADHGRYVIQDLIPGLSNRAPHAHVVIKNRTRSPLPPITSSVEEEEEEKAAEPAAPAQQPAEAESDGEMERLRTRCRMLEDELAVVKAELDVKKLSTSNMSIMPTLSQMHNVSANSPDMVQSGMPVVATEDDVAIADGKIEVKEKKSRSGKQRGETTEHRRQSSSTSLSVDELHRKAHKFKEKLNRLHQKYVSLKAQYRECQNNTVHLENKYHKLQTTHDALTAETTALREGEEQLRQENEGLREEMKEMGHKVLKLMQRNDELLDSREIWKEIGRMKISFTSFELKDVALFYKDQKSGNYVAFSKRLPHRYLSQESLNMATAKHKLGPFIVGEIVYIETKKTSQGSLGNSYNVPPDTTYYVFTVNLVPLKDSD